MSGQRTAIERSAARRPETGRSTPCATALAVALAAACLVALNAYAQAPAPNAAAPATAAPAKQRSTIVQRTFATPEEAGSALIEALDSDNNRTIYAVLGRGGGAVFRSGDPVQDEATRSAIAADYRIRVRYEKAGDAKTTMLLGDKDYPFPYPIVKTAAGWQFDAKGGAEEIVQRDPRRPGGDRTRIEERHPKGGSPPGRGARHGGRRSGQARRGRSPR